MSKYLIQCERFPSQHSYSDGISWLMMSQPWGGATKLKLLKPQAMAAKCPGPLMCPLLTSEKQASPSPHPPHNPHA